MFSISYNRYMYVKEVKINDLNYALNNDFTAEIILSPDAGECVFVPSSIIFESHEYIITSIRSDSFRGNRKIKSIKFAPKSSIKYFGKSVFSNSKIESLSIPASVEKLERGWCKDTPNLVSISISPKNSNFIYLEQKIIVGKSGTVNDNEYDVILFARRDITNFKMPSFIKYIHPYAFSECNYLSTIEFTRDSNLLSISKNAFLLCKINSITIPANVKELEDGWCQYTSKLTNIFLSSRNKLFKFLDIENKIIIEKSKDSEGQFDTINLASRNISHASIPSYIKYINSGSFSECKKLKSIEIPNDSELRIIGKNAFFRTAIDKIFIPKHVLHIKRCAFMNCSNLSLVEFDENSELQTIGNTAFSGSIIQSIKIPNHVKIIESFTFSDCSSLKIVEFTSDSELQVIDKYAFSFSSIRNLLVPKNVNKIGDSAFYKCENLYTVDFSLTTEIKTIDNAAFAFSFIKRITIPKSVEKIDDYAFFKCRYLREVEFPENSQLKIIGEYAFSGSSIEKFYILPNVKELKEGWCCHTLNLDDIIISPFNKMYSYLDISEKIVVGKTNEINNIFDIIIIASRNILDVIIPSFIKQICSGAFACEFLRKIIFDGDSQLELIGESAFYNSSIQTIMIPPLVKCICNETFSLCTELQSVEFLGNEYTFGNNCFHACELLFLISFPNAKKICLPNNEFCEIIDDFYLFTEINCKLTQIKPNL